MRCMPLHLAVMKSQPAVALHCSSSARTRVARRSRLFGARSCGLMAHDMVSMLLDAGAKLRVPAAVALGRDADVPACCAEIPAH